MSTSISVITNGIRVHGLITHRSHSDLTVAITSPIAGFSLGASHIPYFARSHKNYLDSQSDGLATELLEALYGIACYVLARKEQLQEARLQPSGLLEALGNIQTERASITHKKRAAKKQLAEGKLAQRDYQGLLKELRREDEQCQSLESTQKAEFIRHCLPECCDQLCADELLQWLQAEHNQ
ncbi:hypothetical protein [Endozoicomonas sp.]|uniref:hypothetical protein n=1 Tax=Endozoicomonas sp. TaxID=1892382 RepID=UPI00383B1F8B